MSNQPSIAIILINWNGFKDTRECIASLLKAEYKNYRIVVVDNASTDGSLEKLKTGFRGKVHFIENSRNLGFTGANNRGFQYAVVNDFDYVFVLNNDAVVDKDILKEFAGFMEENRDENIGILSPKIYNYYRPNTIESKGGIIDVIRSRNYPLAFGEVETEEKDKRDAPYEISFATGSAMFIKVGLLRKIGFFDRDYFAYYEDQDFCYKAVKSGFKIYYCPKAKVWHKVSSSTGGYKNPLAIYLSTRNRIKFVRKNGKLHQKLIFFPYFFFYYTPTFSAWSIINKDFTRLRSFWRALLSYPLPFLRIDDIEPLNKGFLRIGINARYIQRQITGIERYTLELIKNIEKIDTKNRFVLFYNKHEKIPKITKSQNFTDYISRFPTKNVFFRILWEEMYLSQEIKSKRIDVFHGPSFVVPMIKPKNCRYVITIHDLSWFYYPESFTFFNKLFFRVFLPNSIKKADVIIADSRSTKNDIIKFYGVNPEKIKVIYLGIDKDFCRPSDAAKNSLILRKYGLPEDYILSIGSLLPRKNIVNIIRAFYDLKKKGLKEKLVIIGKKAWLYEQIFSIIKDFNIREEVIFTGYVEDKNLPYLYSSAKLLLFPSFYEGFGLPILEAMSCGCPVITSKVSSMPEVAGDAALLVDPKNIGQISKSIEKLIKDESLRKDLINRGYEQAKKFSWEKTANETLAMYKKA